jgi:hypothetical protein
LYGLGETLQTHGRKGNEVGGRKDQHMIPAEIGKSQFTPRTTESLSVTLCFPSI